METRPTESTIAECEVQVASASAQTAMSWAWNEFGTGCCVLASMQDTVLIDVAMSVSRHIPIVFLDNGYHFEATHQTRRAVEARYGIEVEVVGPFQPVEIDIEPGACCDLKPALLDEALAGRDAWISGLSRVHTEGRADALLIETDRRGKTKINPLAQWNDADRLRYVAEHDLVAHPMTERGFSSIGCAPCTTRPTTGGRSGRWAGSERTECGLHV